MTDPGRLDARQETDRLVIALGGGWTIDAATALESEIRRVSTAPGPLNPG